MTGDVVLKTFSVQVGFAEKKYAKAQAKLEADGDFAEYERSVTEIISDMGETLKIIIRLAPKLQEQKDLEFVFSSNVNKAVTFVDNLTRSFMGYNQRPREAFFLANQQYQSLVNQLIGMDINWIRSS